MKLCTVAVQIVFTISQTQSNHKYNMDKCKGVITDAENGISFRGEGNERLKSLSNLAVE